MAELHHQDPVLGPCVVLFDGRVLELFNQRWDAHRRLIAELLTVVVRDPNRRGYREVQFDSQPNLRGGGFSLHFTEAEWPAAAPFIEEILAAAYPR